VRLTTVSTGPHLIASNTAEDGADQKSDASFTRALVACASAHPSAEPDDYDHASTTGGPPQWDKGGCRDPRPIQAPI
jgi:hypothetical protein